MDPSTLADPPEADMAFVHRVMLLMGGLVGLGGFLFGLAGFVYFVIL